MKRFGNTGLVLARMKVDFDLPIRVRVVLAREEAARPDHEPGLLEHFPDRAGGAFLAEAALSSPGSTLPPGNSQ
jgi:hypothetical protein